MCEYWAGAQRVTRITWPAQAWNNAYAATTPTPPFMLRANLRTMLHNTSDNSVMESKLIINVYRNSPYFPRFPLS